MMSSDTKPGKRARNPSLFEWQVDPACKGASLVDHLAEQLLVSPEEASDLIDFGSVYVDGRQARTPPGKLAGTEQIRVHMPWHGPRRFYEIDPGRILYRDGHLLAYDKEAGIPSQQVPSDAYNNLYAALYRYLSKENPDPYVALHHRLDQETSGVMVFAVDRSVNRKVGKAFEEHRVIKDYLAWATGRPLQEIWTARHDIGRKDGRYRACPRGQGKAAETAFRLLRQEEDQCLVHARPKTGRTHQIRLHLAAAGHPVVGDRLYGGKPSDRLFLHAYRMRLPHPVSAAELTLTAPAPRDWPPPRSVTIPD